MVMGWEDFGKNVFFLRGAAESVVVKGGVDKQRGSSRDSSFKLPPMVVSIGKPLHTDKYKYVTQITRTIQSAIV